MEMENLSCKVFTSKKEEEEVDDDVPLPGFRFHPTDEELVSFYLRRKVEKRPISIELIKQIDIYKYDPWDLPKGSNVGDKEWYFFCKRGRKYRNSIRPNRVTGSGFWKATGIDKSIYSAAGACIGLKKSLVFYRGSAGKGTKTDWMMHEFRLPADDHDHKTTNHSLNAKTIPQEAAEVWTLCRIIKRNISYKNSIPDWKKIGHVKRSHVAVMEADHYNINNMQNYISFNTPIAKPSSYIERKPLRGQVDVTNQVLTSQLNSESNQMVPSTVSCSSFMGSEVNDFLMKHEDWDELRSVVEFAGDPLFY